MISPELLKYYNQELAYLREQGSAFADRYPKVAQRLGMEATECKDPYVERLLESVAFLTAKLNRKMDSEFSRFTEQLLDSIAPELLAPMPSVGIVQFDVDESEGSLISGYTMEKGSALRSQVVPGEQTSCEFRLCQDLDLWPIRVVDAEYTQDLKPFRSMFANGEPVESCLQITLEVPEHLSLSELGMDELELYLEAPNPLLDHLLRLMLRSDTQIAVIDDTEERFEQRKSHLVRSDQPRPVSPVHLRGFNEEDAVLPTQSGVFDGYRLLLEYFNFPERFQFIRIPGLQSAIQSIQGHRMTLVLGFSESYESLARLKAEHFRTHCAPVINLFSRTCDHVPISAEKNDHAIIVDRSCPADYEIYRVNAVSAYQGFQSVPDKLLPFYSHTAGLADNGQPVYSLTRYPNQYSAKRSQQTGYVGTEVYLILSDVSAELGVQETPYKTAGVEVLCTNRDLPFLLRMVDVRYSSTSNAPVENVTFRSGPSKPKPPLARSQTNSLWQLISYLSQNYLSLRPSRNEEALEQIRRMLAVHAPHEAACKRLIKGLVAVDSKPHDYLDTTHFPPSLVRGIEVSITVDEDHFQGFSPVLFSKVMSFWLGHFAELNTTVELSVRTLQSEETIASWPMIVGQRGLVDA